MPETPFAVLSFIAGPAILANACSVMALSTSNRFARAVDRAKEIAAELRSEGVDPRTRRHDLRQFALLNRRTHLLLNAMKFFYAAIGGFAASALLSIIGAVMPQAAGGAVLTGAIWAAVITGVLAVGSLVMGATTLVRETQLALRTMHEQFAPVRKMLEETKAA